MKEIGHGAGAPLLLSDFVYTVLDWLSGPLLGSQRHCHADALSAALVLGVKESNFNAKKWAKIFTFAYGRGRGIFLLPPLA